MGNKKDPRIVVVTDAITLLTDLSTRSSVVFKNEGANPVDLHRLSASWEFGDGFPLEAGGVWSDNESTDRYYAVCSSGLASDVRVWEVEK